MFCCGSSTVAGSYTGPSDGQARVQQRQSVTNDEGPTRGKAILFGPHMSNVERVAAEFIAKGAAIEVTDGAGLRGTLAKLLADDEKRIAMGRQALAISLNADAAVANNYALAARYLSDELGVSPQVDE